MASTIPAFILPSIPDHALLKHSQTFQTKKARSFKRGVWGDNSFYFRVNSLLCWQFWRSRLWKPHHLGGIYRDNFLHGSRLHEKIDRSL